MIKCNLDMKLYDIEYSSYTNEILDHDCYQYVTKILFSRGSYRRMMNHLLTMSCISYSDIESEVKILYSTINKKINYKRNLSSLLHA